MTAHVMSAGTESTPVSTDQMLRAALAHHQAKEYQQAEVLYRRVLQQSPNHPDGLHLLGVLALQHGKLPLAEQLVRQAIERSPRTAPFHNSLGRIFAAQGLRDAAIRSYARATELDPNFVEPYINLAAVYREQGRLNDALTMAWQASTIRPHDPNVHHDLAQILAALNRHSEAITEYQRSLSFDSANPIVYNNLANSMMALGQLHDAVSLYRHAIALRPQFAEAHCNLGQALQRMGKTTEAEAEYITALGQAPRTAEAYCNLAHLRLAQNRPFEAAQMSIAALKINPSLYTACNNLGSALLALGRDEEADQALRRAVTIQPNFADALNNLGNLARDRGFLGEAVAHFTRAMALNPSCAETHWNLGAIHLLTGNYADGWREYEWRWKTPVMRTESAKFAQPLWNGEPLAGRTLLLHSEQGFGDTIQFVRYAPLVAERFGGRVILQCQPALKVLFQSLPATVKVIDQSEKLPRFDLHCPLLNLPRVFGTTVETIPAEIPYLKADPALVAHWREKLGDDDRVTVGLVWAGNPNQRDDRHRSCDLSVLAPLASTGGVRFVSLQKGPRAAQAEQPPAGMELVNLGPELRDFADTAAVLANLDLYIGTCTSVTHLAGAMGVPCWTLLCHLPDWRWMLDRSDSPWYPTMTLFRQRAPRDWPGVVERVACELGEFVRRCPGHDDHHDPRDRRQVAHRS